MGELRSPGKLKHAPPMLRSRLEMAKLQPPSARPMAPSGTAICTSHMAPNSTIVNVGTTWCPLRKAIPRAAPHSAALLAGAWPRATRAKKRNISGTQIELMRICGQSVWPRKPVSAKMQAPSRDAVYPAFKSRHSA